jgi:hypothetical protein
MNDIYYRIKKIESGYEVSCKSELPGFTLTGEDKLDTLRQFIKTLKKRNGL